MKANKYYTPDITELHVGFEYETRDRLSVLLESRKWNHSTFNKFNDMKSIRMCLDTDRFEIRVKHLDREDIEGFGFEMNDIFKDNTEKDLYYNNSVMTPRGEQSVGVYHVPQTMWCMIFFGNKNDIGDWSIEKMPNKTTIDFHTNTVFAGQIRNKSELKRVLTQIGVI